MGAFTGIGTRFQRKESGAWEDIAGLLSIGGPATSRDTVDTTSMDNEDGYRDFITGLRDNGTMSFELLFAKDQYTGMKEDFESDTPKDYQIFFAQAQAGAIQFQGLVTDFPLTVPLDDKVSMSVTIKVTGEIDVPDNGPYMVEYDANGATGGEVPLPQTKEHDAALVLRDNTGLLEKDDHVFVGWNTQADGAGTSYDESDSFALNAYTVLYAEWEAL